MKHLKTFHESFGDRLYRFIATGKLGKKPKLKSKWTPNFQDWEISNIKDMFQSCLDDAGLPGEEDPNGDLNQYTQLHGVNKRRNPKPQYFVEHFNDNKLLRFSVSHKDNFMSVDYLKAIERFKKRMELLGFICSQQDVWSRDWCIYISFWIQKDWNKSSSNT